MVWPDKTDTSKKHGIRLYLSDGGHLILRVDRYPEKWEAQACWASEERKDELWSYRMSEERS